MLMKMRGDEKGRKDVQIFGTTGDIRNDSLCVVMVNEYGMTVSFEVCNHVPTNIYTIFSLIFYLLFLLGVNTFFGETVASFTYIHFLMKPQRGESLIRMKSSWVLLTSLIVLLYL